ncbi:LysR family transcriptional regulator [Jannaschia sp. Os4]|uniref:LysR family transcriptional regulator n=1 Tax=Jannaschia sp. Os4 TaxID=2807617 RepID=UPI00193941BC|nr:LysR family transcriptional regulator [Jannaschia sp. Os4]MBM2575938.1 LysR family transcriptional regulator [Jannaschia sp. Os4]
MGRPPFRHAGYIARRFRVDAAAAITVMVHPMRDDRLTQMRVLLAVIETGGFSAAARSLGASQPFVSETVARLEERLGARLLDRTTRTMAPTPEGLRYVEGARAAVLAADAAEEGLTGGRLDGTLRLTAPSAFGLDRVRPALPAFLDAHPGLEVELILTDDRVDLIGERIDVAVRMGRLPDSTLVSRKLCDLHRILVAAPSLVDRLGTPAAPADLAGWPLLAWTGPRAGLNRWRFLDGAEVHARGRFRSDDGQALFAACVDGHGAMRCAEHLARPALRDGRLVELLPGRSETHDGAIYAVTLPGRREARLRALVAHLVQTFRAAAW